MRDPPRGGSTLRRVRKNLMKKTSQQLRFAELPKEYRRLCDLYLPRPIHDKIGYENALELAEVMAGFEMEFIRTTTLSS
jgi:hypothetical protein